MTYTINHTLIDQDVPVSVAKRNGFATVHCSTSGSFRLRFPGKLQVSSSANYSETIFPPKIEGEPVGKPQETREKSLPLHLEIRKPDGTLFTGDHITLNDLNEFRDLRRVSQGEWTFRFHGQSAPIFVEDKLISVSAGEGHVGIAVEETITSKSAPPLVTDKLLTNSGRRYEFDLFRVGTFTAIAPNRGMVLFEPDGNAVATRNGHLTFPVTLKTLDKSRDAAGNPRLWSLEILPFHLPTMLPIDRPEGEEPDPNPKGPTSGIPTTVFASVIETARIRTSVLNERINKLIGEGDSQLSIFSEMTDSDLLARLIIKDDFTAETMDMHGLLDHVIKTVRQDSGINTENIKIEKNVIYNLYRRSRIIFGMKVSSLAMRVKAINIHIGASEHIQPAIPVLKMEVVFEESNATVEFHGFDLATAKIRDNHIGIEVGLRLDANGSFSPEIWIEQDRLDVDVSWEAALAFLGVDVLSSGGLLSLGAQGTAEVIEEGLTDLIESKFRNLLTSFWCERHRELND